MNCLWDVSQSSQAGITLTLLVFFLSNYYVTIAMIAKGLKEYNFRFNQDICMNQKLFSKYTNFKSLTMMSIFYSS